MSLEQLAGGALWDGTWPKVAIIGARTHTHTFSLSGRDDISLNFSGLWSWSRLLPFVLATWRGKERIVVQDIIM